MAAKTYKGIPYHLWNPYTDMDRFSSFLGMGPTIISRGEGHYLYNDLGKPYINGNSCTWNFSIGFGREEIIETATRQMRELPFSSCWNMVHPKAIELAAKLVEITSGNFAHVYLGSNGTEAVETALKLARQYQRQSPDAEDRGRFKIVSLSGSYHGFAYGVASLAGSDIYTEKFGPMLPGIHQIEPPYCYRCPYGKDGYPGCELVCAQALEEAIQSEGEKSVAAFIMEPIMGEYGAVEPPHEYYHQVGEICQRYGLLFIVDEVTTGFGRTGKLFASQDWEIQPDILCLGKAISGGYLPLAATLTTNAIYQRFLGKDNFFRHGSTNSGHPVCAAVGLTAIDIILRENLPENAARVGAYIKSGLEALMDDHPIIGEVRGSGLMIAIDLTKDRKTKRLFSNNEIFNILLNAVQRGMLLSYNDKGLNIFPPLNIDEVIADEIVAIMDKALHIGLLTDMNRNMRLLKDFAISKLKP